MAYLEFKNVSFSFIQENETVLILKDCSFIFPKKGLVSILGESGSGKSTILNLIAGYLTSYKGEIIKDYPNSNTGFVFQNLYLLDHLKVKDNILLGKILNGEDRSNSKLVEELLIKVNLAGYENKKVKNLSGGQKARVAIARSLANDSKILLLDEPTGCLDSENSIQIMEIIKKLSKDILIIVVTHNKELAYKYSDEIVLIKDKKLASQFNNTNIKSCNIAPPSKVKKKKIKLSQNIFLSWSFLKSRFKKVGFSLLFLSICLSLISLCLNLSTSGKKAIEDYTKSSFDYTLVNLQEKKKYEIENQKMQLIKMDVVSSKNQKILKNENIDIKFYSNLEYFLPNVVSLKYNTKYLEEKIYLLPSFPNKNKLQSGNVPIRYNQVIINEVLYNLLNKTSYNKNGLSYFNSVNIESKYLGENTKDLIDLKLNFEISGISKEKTFLDRPIIYYSYDLMSNYILNKEMKNLSKLCNFSSKVNVKYRIENLSYDNDTLTSFKSLAYIKEPLVLKRLIDEKYNEDLTLISTSIELNESISEILDSISKIVLIFLILSVVSSLFLELVIIENIYQEKKIELGIYLSFYIDLDRFKSLGIGQIIIFFIINILLTLGLTYSFSILGNYLLNLYGLPKLFSNVVDIKTLSIIFIVSFVINYICTIFPLKRMYSTDLISNLKGE